MMKRKEFMLGAVAGLTIAAAATAGGVIDWPTAEADPIAGKSGRLTANPGGAPNFAPPQGAPLSFADIFQQVAPAVVQIEVESRVTAPEGVIQIPGLPFEFRVPEAEEGEEAPTRQGAGSGFFISADGFIVTNNHVVADATEITVTLSDERELTATLVGRDPRTDLAVLKVEGTDFPFVSFEDRAEPRVGDWVIAVGNPFGLGGTATAGIVSAKARDIDPTSYNDFIQIDAAINRGNSGGPTFDIYGRVIGVNSVILSPTGVSVGIGFAIPAAVAKTVTDQLMRGETVQRGYVGVGIRGLTPDMYEVLGLPEDFGGALVESVTEGGPADRAGVEIGDFIVGVNGEEVESSTDVTRRIAAIQPGESLQLRLQRDGRQLTVNTRAGTRPSEEDLAAESGQGSREPDQRPSVSGGEAVEGMALTPLTPELRRRYSIPDAVQGLVVGRVTEGTPAARARLQSGVVISRANNRAMTSIDDFRQVVAAARQAGRSGVLLQVWTPTGNSVGVLPLSSGE